MHDKVSVALAINS